MTADSSVDETAARGSMYGYGGRIDSIRANEFGHLDGVAYCDHAGAPPHSSALVREALTAAAVAVRPFTPGAVDFETKDDRGDPLTAAVLAAALAEPPLLEGTPSGGAMPSEGAAPSAPAAAAREPSQARRQPDAGEERPPQRQTDGGEQRPSRRRPKARTWKSS